MLSYIDCESCLPFGYSACSIAFSYCFIIFTLTVAGTVSITAKAVGDAPVTVM